MGIRANLNLARFYSLYWRPYRLWPNVTGFVEGEEAGKSGSIMIRMEDPETHLLEWTISHLSSSDCLLLLRFAAQADLGLLQE